MREFLTSGQVGSIELNEQKRIRQEINKRWDALGTTEGLKGVVKENAATLFENEAKALLSEATASDNSGSFETVVFPIIRRVFSKLLANDIVSVQAMNLPVGRLFFMLPVTSEREFNGTIEDALDKDADVIGRHKGLMGYERTDRHNGSRYNRFYLPDEAVNGMKFIFVNAETDEEQEVDLTFANYDEATAAPASTVMPQELVEQYHLNSNFDPNTYVNPDAVMPATGADNGLTLADMRGLDYDDPKWDLLLDQLTVDEMANMIALCGYQTPAMESVGKVRTLDMDGPAAINNNFTGYGSLGFPIEIVIANTWSNS